MQAVPYSDDLAALAATTVQRARAIAGTDGAALLWFDPELRVLVPLAWDDVVGSEREDPAFHPGQAVIGRVFASGAPEVHGDFMPARLGSTWAADVRMRACAAVPVPAPGGSGAIGVMSVVHPAPVAFGAGLADALSGLAAEVAPALARMAPHARADRRRTEAVALAALMRDAARAGDRATRLGAIARTAARLVGADFAGFRLAEPSAWEAVFGARAPDGVTGTDAPVAAVRSAQELVSALELELARGEQSLGTLLLGWRTDVRPSDELRSLAETLAGHAATLLAPGAPPRGQGGPSLAGDLARALDTGGGGITLAFQPIVRAGDLHPIRAEALLRWQHPERGPIAPPDVVTAAERAGLMPRLTSWVLDQACRACASWRAAGHDIGVAVNVTAQDLRSDGLRVAVRAALALHEIPPQALVLELTEHALLEDPEAAVVRLDPLLRLGVGLAIDDFGTGWASLTRLRHLPATELKVDRTFVAGLLQGGVDAVLVRSALDLASALGLESVAEGVEDDGTADALRAAGCTQLQGYRYSAPLAAADFEAWLAARH